MQEIKNYLQNEAPVMAANKTLRFIDGNFAAKGYQGATGFKTWKPTQKKSGSTLINTGTLRRSFNYNIQPFQANIFSNIPYAKRHNEGFKGTEKIKAHTRSKYYKASLSIPRINKTGKKRANSIHVFGKSFLVKEHSVVNWSQNFYNFGL